MLKGWKEPSKDTNEGGYRDQVINLVLNLKKEHKCKRTSEVNTYAVSSDSSLCIAPVLNTYLVLCTSPCVGYLAMCLTKIR